MSASSAALSGSDAFKAVGDCSSVISVVKCRTFAVELGVWQANRAVGVGSQFEGSPGATLSQTSHAEPPGGEHPRGAQGLEENGYMASRAYADGLGHETWAPASSRTRGSTRSLREPFRAKMVSASGLAETRFDQRP